MNTIYKYPFEIVDVQTLMTQGLTPGAIRHVGLDPNGEPCIWVEVQTDRAFEAVTLFIVGTGHPIPPGAFTFIGTFNQGPFMWHVYTG